MAYPAHASSTNCDLRIPHKNVSPTDPSFRSKNQENWLALERWVTYRNRECGCEMSEVHWSRPLGLTSSTSPAWQSDQKRQAIGARVIINGEVDTADITIDIIRNGSTIGQVTVPAGDNWATTVFSSAANFGPDGEFLYVQASDLGDGVATKVTVIVYLTCGGEAGTPPEPGGGGGE